MIKILDLCSGIGGFSLGLEATGGFETVAFCEFDEFCCKVLNKHWPGVPIYNDLKELGNDPKRIIQEFDLICGGIPCQPFSVAGKKKGKEDDRHLWPYMYEIVKHKKPTWVIVENVGGFVNVALDDVCLDLEAQGYATQSFVIPACSVEAPHRRDRVWILGKFMGDTSSDGRNESESSEDRGAVKRGEEKGRVLESKGASDVENSRRSLRQRGIEQGENGNETRQGHADQLERSSSTSKSDVAHASIEGLEGRISGDNQGGQERQALSRGKEQQHQVGADTRCGSGLSTKEDVPNSSGKGLQGHRGEHGLREASEEEQASRSSQEQDVANAKSIISNGGEHRKLTEEREGQRELGGESGSEREKDVSNSGGKRGCSREAWSKDAEDVGQLSGGKEHRQGHTEPGVGGMADGLSARLDGHFGFEVEPNIPRVATGIPDRVNRLKALGNSIVPQIIRNIGLAILKNEEDDRRL